MRGSVLPRASIAVAALLLFALDLRAESRIEKTLRLDPGGRFSLDTDMGSVTITGTNSPAAKLVITSRRRELEDLLRFDFREEAGSVSVTARRKHGRIFGWTRGDSVHWEVQVPAQTVLDVDTSGGRIKIAGIRSDARLETSGGGIEVRDLVGDLTGHTSGGGIALHRIRGRMRVETSGGGIEGTELDGPIDADTSGGSVRLDRVSGDIRAHNRSEGGAVFEVRLPAS